MNDKNFEDLRNGRRSHEESPESQNNSDGSDSDQGENGLPYLFLFLAKYKVISIFSPLITEKPNI